MQCRFSKARIIDTFFSGLKQGRNLRRESAFYVTLAVQVSAIKWNLHHFSLCFTMRNLANLEGKVIEQYSVIGK